MTRRLDGDGSGQPPIPERREPQLRESCAGGIVFYGDRILILQKQSGDWVFPKGHIEPRETPAEAALREVLEESGITAATVGPTGFTSYQFWSRGRKRVKTVAWFAMRTDSTRYLRAERIFRQAEFVLPAEAERRLTFANDRALVEAAWSTRERSGAGDDPQADG